MVDQAAGLLAGAGFSQPMHSGSLKLEATNTSLAAGPLYNEVMSAAKSGGGRIVLEVNPDNMGPIQIDLQIDQNGQALMIVNGASDATQARLEQGSSQLRQEFAQMGLNLSLICAKTRQVTTLIRAVTVIQTHLTTVRHNNLILL